MKFPLRTLSSLTDSSSSSTTRAPPSVIIDNPDESISNKGISVPKVWQLAPPHQPETSFDVDSIMEDVSSSVPSTSAIQTSRDKSVKRLVVRSRSPETRGLSQQQQHNNNNHHNHQTLHHQHHHNHRHHQHHVYHHQTTADMKHANDAKLTVMRDRVDSLMKMNSNSTTAMATTSSHSTVSNPVVSSVPIASSGCSVASTNAVVINSGNSVLFNNQMENRNFSSQQGNHDLGPTILRYVNNCDKLIEAKI